MAELRTPVLLAACSTSTLYCLVLMPCFCKVFQLKLLGLGSSGACTDNKALPKLVNTVKILTNDFFTGWQSTPFTAGEWS